MRNKEKKSGRKPARLFYTVYFENFIPDASLLEDVNPTKRKVGAL